MRTSYLYTVAGSALAMLLWSMPGRAQISLLTEQMTAPLGIDSPQPRFSWQLEEGTEQKAYALQLSSDSMQVVKGKSSVTLRAETDRQYCDYDSSCESLQPMTRYFWRVDITHPDGTVVSSPVTAFETGKMTVDQWRGAWISDGHDINFRPAPYFRRRFNLDKPIKSARAYIAVAGLYRLSLNGQVVGNHFLDPAFTRYDRRILYVTHDVTSLLQQGDNAVGVLLGNGWYNHQAKAVWNFDSAPWRRRPAFCMDLHIEYADGTSELIATDGSWRTSQGPLIYNNLYTGEHHDFRIPRFKGWDTPSYDDSFWEGVQLRAVPAPVVSAQLMVPIRQVEHITPASIRKIGPSHVVYDFGRNMAGVATIKLRGTEGTKVMMRYGERLKADGTLDMTNIDVYYRGDSNEEPFQTDILYLDGNDNEFCPQFSYKGFRYVEVEADGDIDIAGVTAHFVHSDVPVVGTIASANPLLDKIFAATNQAYISNLMGYPTDCPQREKNGWTGDGHLAIETALYTYDAYTVYRKWLQDHRDEQQPNGVLPDIIPTGGWGYGTDNGLDWTSTIAIIPWNIYLFYGDERPLRECYDNIRRYVDYVDRMSPSHLSSWGRGDWVPVRSHSDKELSSSIYFYIDALILAKAATMFGFTADSQRYTVLASDIRNAINRKFLNVQTGIYAGGSQTEMSMPLMWGVVPDDMRAKVAGNLAADVRRQGYHLDVGVLGCKAILNALSENGYAYEAWRIAVQDTYPSWGYWVKNGATSLLENWDLKAERDISDNHIMFGEIGAWMYKGLGGIFPDETKPGFRHIILRPNFIRELPHFEASHRSPYGQIKSSWSCKGKKVTYKVTIPAGCTATLYFPNGSIRELSSGTHSMQVTL